MAISTFSNYRAMAVVSQTYLGLIPTRCSDTSVRAHVLIPAPKRLLTCSANNILRVHLAPAAQGSRRRLDVHVLISKGTSSDYHLSKMHVLVEPIHIPEAEEWVEETMRAAYPCKSSHVRERTIKR